MLINKNTIERIFNQVDANKKEIFILLKRLLSASSVTGNELSAQFIVEEKFLEMGLKIERIKADYQAIARNPEFKGNRYVKLFKSRNRFNVIGRFGSGQKPKILLFSHIDTLPAQEELWHFKPFGGEIKGTRMYGRGAADNKCGVAIMTMALKSILDSGIALDKEVILASTIGEEFGRGGFGYEGIFSCLNSCLEADFAICPHGRPSPNFTLSVGCGGYIFFNSEEDEHQVLAKAREVNKHRLQMIKIVIQKTPVFGKLKHHEPIIIPAQSHRIKDFPALKRWRQLNFLPFEDKHKIYAILKKYFPKTEIVVAMEPSLLNPEHSFVSFIRKKTSRVYEKEPSLIIQNSGSDTRFLNSAGVPTVSFGPFSGNSHGIDEWVDLPDLIKCVKVVISSILD